MSKQIDKNLFMDFSLPRFYQHLLKGIASFEELGNRIIRGIKTAHAFRQTELVRRLSSILINLPIKEYQLIGQYYLVWCKCRSREYDTDSLETIIEQTREHKAQALLSRGSFEFYQNKNDSALYFYAEGLKSAHTVSEYVSLSLAIAITKSVDGFHKLALMDLEKLIPFIKHVEPRLYYDFLNSYALELGEAGRKEEARSVINHVIASPFIHAYPEWQETAQELKEPDRSFVTVPSIEPVEIEAIEAHHASESERVARVVAFPQLKEAPEPQKPDRFTPQEWSGLNLSEKRELVLTAIRTGTYTMFDYDRLMVMVGLLECGPADKVLDLEDEETLRDLIVVWAHQIEPEELAAVLSTIRDCENDKRRNNIIDRMIRIAFEETQLCGLTEEAWRFRVERRLPKK